MSGQGWRIVVLHGVVAAAAFPAAALADCTAPGSIIECTGDTPTVGYGNGTQSGQTIHVNTGASVSGGANPGDAGLSLGALNTVIVDGAVNGHKAGIVTTAISWCRTTASFRALAPPASSRAARSA